MSSIALDSITVHDVKTLTDISSNKVSTRTITEKNVNGP